MKVCRGFLLAISSFLLSACDHWTAVEKVEEHWNGSLQTYSVTTEKSKIDEAENGDFHRVRIKTPSGIVFEVVNTDGWVAFTAVERESLRSTGEKTYALIPICNNGSERALVLTGYGYASDPPRFDVVTLCRGAPVLTATLDHFDAVRVEDVDHDSLNEVIGYRWYAQGLNDIISEYCPFFVYRFTVADGLWAFVYDDSLSKGYNITHGTGWAGPRFTEEYVRVKPRDGTKPRLMKRDAALRRYGSTVK